MLRCCHLSNSGTKSCRQDFKFTVWLRIPARRFEPVQSEKLQIQGSQIMFGITDVVCSYLTSLARWSRCLSFAKWSRLSMAEKEKRRASNFKPCLNLANMCLPVGAGRCQYIIQLLQLDQIHIRNLTDTEWSVAHGSSIQAFIPRDEAMASRGLAAEAQGRRGRLLNNTGQRGSSVDLWVRIQGAGEASIKFNQHERPQWTYVLALYPVVHTGIIVHKFYFIYFFIDQHK